jgi:tetratricopeptide (TPR) repeat protein
VQSVPALAAVTAVVVLILCRLSLPAQELAARYQERAAAAARAKDYATALVCFERLADLGNDRPENLYEMAVALAQRGQPEQAFEVMNQLAPLDRTGYGPAHLWQALYHWKEGLANPEYRKRAEEHLEKALTAGLPDPDAAHGLLGELLAQSRRPEEAEPHLEHAVRTRPHLRLRYAQVLAAQGKKGRAADEGKLAANFYQARAKADAANKGARIAWSECVAFLEEFPQALEILADGLNLTGDRDYRAAMARVYAAWHLFLVRTAPDDVAKQWQLLENGLRLDGTNPVLLNRLVGLMGKGADDADKARAVMQKVLVDGSAPATSHFLLGMDAWQQGDAAKAELHWGRANELAPHMPVVANNLAWLLAHAAKPDLPRALGLINRVIDQFPQELSYRDTRAHVYLKMQRWRDALTDLEWVRGRDPNFPGIQASLAEVYTGLGMRDLASKYRQAAEARAKKAATP